jgi:hypothetical protein
MVATQQKKKLPRIAQMARMRENFFKVVYVKFVVTIRRAIRGNYFYKKDFN